MSDLIQYIDKQKDLFLPALTDTSIIWDKEKQFAYQALTNNSFLMGVAEKNTTSLQNAIINIATIGISLNPVLKHAYLIPRKGAVCLDLSYMGLLHIAQSSGIILWGQAKLVYANDDYRSQGLSKEPVHEYKAFSDRGCIVGVYCTVKTVDGDFLTEEMSLEDVYKIRNRSEGYKAYLKKPTINCIWVSDEGEMIRKTVVKRGYKYWPKCERLGTAIQMLNDGGEGIQVEKDITPDNQIVNFPHDELVELIKGRDHKAAMQWLGVEKIADLTDEQAKEAVIRLRNSKQ